jgi:hypothetical protein
MIFRIAFADGSVEMVQASSVTQARLNAIELFPERIVMEVAEAGLADMMIRKPSPGAPGISRRLRLKPTESD